MDALDKALADVDAAHTELYDLIEQMLNEGPTGTMTELEKRLGWSREWLRKIKKGHRPAVRRMAGGSAT